jgi:rfaE bifunctional protein nucleotidyltransferase chain/domain
VSSFPSSSSKILAHDALAAAVSQRQSIGERVVFTNGVFDLLHVGHVRYLEEARALGDALVVAVNADSSVRGFKGDLRPIVSEHDRAELIASLACVDYVTLFSTRTPVPVIELVRPMVYVKGGDYGIDDLPETPVVRGYGGDVQILSLVKGKSTTNIIAKICRAYPNGAEMDSK